MVQENENIGIIHEHYHVTDAGIRLVLESLSHGIAHHFNNVTQYLWYSPKKFQNRDTPCERFSGKNINLIEDSALGYLTKPFDTVEKFSAAVDQRVQIKRTVIKQKIKTHRMVVHIIQNPTLLKNPVETQANVRIAAQLLDQNYIQIWHIHDLLEDSHYRRQLRDHIKKIAGEKTEESYGRNGCAIAWTTCPNIFYAAINMKDKKAIQLFLPRHLRRNIFYFPDPVDVDRIRVKPVFERNGQTLDDRIITFCRSTSDQGNRYDPEANILVAAEFARERKNTGEQILLLNMLNRLSAGQPGKFQLLVTLIPTVGKDAERITVFQEYIRLNKLPVAMGFGRRVFARGNDENHGRFLLTDLWSHPRAYLAISTSVKEGFGLNFINPAIATMGNDYTLPTVGRRLDDIFPDFEAAGMHMHANAFYSAIVIDASLLCVDSGVLDKDRAHIVKSRLPKRYRTISYDGVIALGKDFSDYCAQDQVVLMDLMDYRRLSKRLHVFADFILDKGKMNRIAKKNAAAVINRLSLSSYTEKLKKMIGKAFSYKKERVQQGEILKMIVDNTWLIDYYQKIEKKSG